jgi:hypothetical protein
VDITAVYDNLERLVSSLSSSFLLLLFVY